MRVLVVVASKHGATGEIAGKVADTLAGRAIRVTVAAAGEAPAPDGFDAVVVGSAVYAGKWLPEAEEFLRVHAAALRALPVWLFSSGPVGAPPKPEPDQASIDARTESVGARGHEVFAGRIDPALLGWTERALVRALRAPTGDFRDWDAIAAWSAGIAAALLGAGEHTPAG